MSISPAFLIIPANLSNWEKGQILYDHPFGTFSFEKSEIRTYLGFERNVNIFTESEIGSYGVGNETADWTVRYIINHTFVYDSITGIILEAETESRNISPDTSLNLRTTSIITNENNIIPEFPISIFIPLFVSITLIGATIRKKFNK